MLFRSAFIRDDRRRRLWAAAALAAGALVAMLAFRMVIETAEAGARVEHNIMGRLSIYGDARRLDWTEKYMPGGFAATSTAA